MNTCPSHVVHNSSLLLRAPVLTCGFVCRCSPWTGRNALNGRKPATEPSRRTPLILRLTDASDRIARLSCCFYMPVAA
eukprot:587210-Pleurochrysis_carterae.AAC.1